MNKYDTYIGVEVLQSFLSKVAFWIRAKFSKSIDIILDSQSMHTYDSFVFPVPNCVLKTKSKIGIMKILIVCGYRSLEFLIILIHR